MVLRALPKMMRTLLLVILIAVFSTPGLFAQSGLRPRGDVNCDWEVKIDDVSELIMKVLSGEEYHSLYTYADDINNDKAVNIQDVVCLIEGLLKGDLAPMPSYSGTLPVLYINTDGYHDIVSKEDYLHAAWWLDAMGIDGYESFGSPEEPLDMFIKGRGNYTWNHYDKKSFRIKLDAKQPLMGMHRNRHFCLMAHADDHLAKLKDEVGFELSRRIGLAYTPVQKPVEVVMNGVYIGLYFLCEKIRVDRDRVNIVEQENFETDSLNITGGWLIEIDNQHDDCTFSVKERNDGANWYDWLWITVHSPDSLSAEQKRYIRRLITLANEGIYSSDKTNAEWDKYIDIDTLAIFYIIQEIMDNVESFSGSCYMHKNRGDDTKLLFGPVWDFGNSFNRGTNSTCHFIYEQPTNYFPHWIEEITKFPKFQLKVRRLWRQIYPSIVTEWGIDNFIDEFVDSFRGAINDDDVRWNRGTNLDDEKERFRYFFHSKVAWLDSQWNFDEYIDPDPQEPS